MPQMKPAKETQRETSQAFTRIINEAGRDELDALERRIERHYNAGTLTVAAFARLDARIMARIAQFECK